MRAMLEQSAERRAAEMHWKQVIGLTSLALLGSAAELAPVDVAAAQARPASSDWVQNVLGPGLYVFQTRTRSSTCGDAERDGYVLSYVAAINGVPGSVAMSMEVVNTPHFKSWSLQVSKENVLEGESRIGIAADAPDAHFTVSRDGERWKGTGFRTYPGKLDGKPTRCRVEFDALLRRVDI
jgi:hypothetical protein